jgi:hypothetical protein
LRYTPGFAKQQFGLYLYLNDWSYPDMSIYAEYADAQAILGFNGCNYLRLRYKTFEQAVERHARQHYQRHDRPGHQQQL